MTKEATEEAEADREPLKARRGAPESAANEWPEVTMAKAGRAQVSGGDTA